MLKSNNYSPKILWLFQFAFNKHQNPQGIFKLVLFSLAELGSGLFSPLVQLI